MAAQEATQPRRPTSHVLVAAAVFFAASFIPWHADAKIRRTGALVLTTLFLWISEAAPLGVVGLLIPIGATFCSVLKWPEALAVWGDPILFLFLGTLLLARALDKHGAFDAILQTTWVRRFRGGAGVGLALVVMLLAGAVSTMQSNTAVTAMLLPLVVPLARTVRNPAYVMLALSYGATFGGMATPIGTPPNFLGYSAMKAHAQGMNFLAWMRVGVPIWIGTSLLAGMLFALAARFRKGKETLPRASAGEGLHNQDQGVVEPNHSGVRADDDDRRAARQCAIAAFGCVVLAWIATGFATSVLPPDHPAAAWVTRYLPESLPPVLAGAALFLIRTGPRRKTVLTRDDFHAVDWDTIFLIAGGLCLGKTLQASGAAAALADAVAHTSASPLAVMFALGVVTVALSELTSNTATAALLVPIAASLAPAVHLSPVRTIWLVALCASLGFALPVSTPPNAIVYGTRLVPLRTMTVMGLLMDALALVWVVVCMHILA